VPHVLGLDVTASVLECALILPLYRAQFPEQVMEPRIKSNPPVRATVWNRWTRPELDAGRCLLPRHITGVIHMQMQRVSTTKLPILILLLVAPGEEVARGVSIEHQHARQGRLLSTLPISHLTLSTPCRLQ
jgi:hypothetical protein